ncbi:hypothetical protein SAMN04488127_2523 [Bhargavaea ginsengi]|uniref:Uncharacterized protein n=1 Tax=Bhargavaea ginsengi TaxID=426757 RepID=A0A1H7AX74_9BACL|nr:hypothetical protein SAMN04488127_2523 [Bhargavaea ginsengi]
MGQKPGGKRFIYCGIFSTKGRKWWSGRIHRRGAGRLGVISGSFDVLSRLYCVLSCHLRVLSRDFTVLSPEIAQRPPNWDGQAVRNILIFPAGAPKIRYNGK